LFTALACWTVPFAAADDGLGQRIDAAIGPAFRAEEPGAVVLVVKDGQTVLRKAYGVADVATHAPLAPATPLAIGSMTKQFTATAVMLLAQRGKLAVNDSLTRYLPDYPVRGRTITIEHLLTHSSGIPDYATTPDWPAHLADTLTPDALIASFQDRPLDFEPGARYAYSNSNYVLLGRIIEKVSGLPYADFLEQNIFAPLGMRDTGVRPPGAPGHVLLANGFEHAAPTNASQLYAAGGLVTTVDDLDRWNAAIAESKLLGAAGWATMFTPHKLADGTVTEYGYGFQVDRWQDTTTIRHGGRIPGYESFAMRLPERQLYVAVLANRDIGRTPAYEIAKTAGTLALGLALPGRAYVSVEPAVFDTYVGRYRMAQPPLVLDVRRKGNDYLMTTAGQTYPLKAVSATRFVAEGAGAELEFGKNASGAATRVTVFQGPVKVVFERVP
jgi:CubicO group peptidase (beta-lactamase class C family)